MVSKVVGLMTNPHKNVVRVDIMNQISDFKPMTRLLGDKKNMLKVMTLPGTNFVFEEMLTSQLRYKGRDVRFVCFESMKERFKLTGEAVPLNVQLVYGKFQDHTKGSDYDVVWADYCCTLKYPKALVNAVRAATASGKETLLYVSFCMARVDYREIGQRLGSPGCTPNRVVERCIEINLKGKGIPFRKIYSVNYAGGSNAGVSMLTVGYHIHPTSQNRPKLIEDDRRHTGEERYKTVKLVESRKPRVVVGKDELSKHILKMFRLNVTQSGHTMKFCLSNKNWRSDFMQRCMERYGCPWQRPTGILNGIRKSIGEQALYKKLKDDMADMKAA